MEQPTLIIQDLSCAGQVSLTAALPILGATGCHPAVLPTALLSTHTGGFGNNTYLDLSNEISKIIKHWEAVPLTFSYILLGYLGKKVPPIITKHLPEITSDKAIILLDPVMADNGRLYQGFDLNYVAQIKKLAEQAKILTPNLTEAELLLGLPLTTTSFVKSSYAQKVLTNLSQLYPQTAILLTGVPLSHDQIAVFGQENFSREIWKISLPQEPANYFGTGDLFASTLLACLIKHKSLQNAVKITMNFIAANIAASFKKSPLDPRIGLDYSPYLPVLLKQLNKKGEQ
jgi:pyridoxine kinase